MWGSSEVWVQIRDRAVWEQHGGFARIKAAKIPRNVGSAPQPGAGERRKKQNARKR